MAQDLPGARRIPTLVMADSKISSDPRPRRMAQWVGSFGPTDILCDEKLEGFNESFLLPEKGTSGVLMNSLGRAYRIARHLYFTSTKRFSRSLWTSSMVSLARGLTEREYELVVSHDLHLLPLAFAIVKPGGKVIFDAREYYPDQVSNSTLWRLLFGARNRWLCREYLSKCALVLTVSPGLQKRYKDEYGIEVELVLSSADFHSIVPTKTKRNNVRLIYHGLANKHRATERMVEAMAYVDPGYSLDLMVKVSDASYERKLRRLCARTSNVRILEPVAFDEIIPTLAQYDIGIFIVPPVNFNLEYCMPNKLFEFLQARLGVIVGPSPDMADFVQKHGVGVVSDSFELEAVANTINGLTTQEIDICKKNAEMAAAKYNSDETSVQVKRLIAELVAR